MVRAALARRIHGPEQVYLGYERELHPARAARDVELHLVRDPGVEWRETGHRHAHGLISVVCDDSEL